MLVETLYFNIIHTDHHVSLFPVQLMKIQDYVEESFVDTITTYLHSEVRRSTKYEQC